VNFICADGFFKVCQRDAQAMFYTCLMQAFGNGIVVLDRRAREVKNDQFDFAHNDLKICQIG
jgi:hypothetical protein